VPCRQVRVDLAKQDISDIRGCGARLLGPDGRLAAVFWAVCPEETGGSASVLCAAREYVR